MRISREFDVRAADRIVTAGVVEPLRERLSADPLLLLTFATDRVASLTSGEDGLLNTRLRSAAEESARRGQPVEFADF